MSAEPWLEFRRLMPVANKWAYLDHAAVAPLPKPTSEAIQTWAEQAATEGDTIWSSWSRRVREVRESAARMINAEPSEVALVPSTTAGIGLVAEGWPWRPGDNVVTLSNEFPSNLYPWLNLADRGVETRRVECPRGRVDLGRLMDACDGRTRIVTVSWVGFASGWRLDVAELAERAHRHGALLMLDAIQGLGVFPLDVRETEVDFVAADGHKWMLGPEGAGLFYLKQEHLNRLRPMGVGWNSVVGSHDFDHIDYVPRPTAARYEGGTLNMGGFLGLGSSLDLLARFGLAADESAIADQVLAVAQYASDRLLGHGAVLKYERPVEHATGIVTFEVPGHDLAQIRVHCLQNGVALSVRGGGLRISIHAYNTREDIDRLVDCLPRVTSG